MSDLAGRVAHALAKGIIFFVSSHLFIDVPSYLYKISNENWDALG